LILPHRHEKEHAHSTTAGIKYTHSMSHMSV
jgi:hypothetical protein